MGSIIVEYDKVKLLWTEIDLDQLACNMRIIRNLAQSPEIAAVIKADAYGHGSVAIADTLLQNGADRLAVARLDEAIELRHHGITAPIFVLGYTPPARAIEAIAYNVALCVYNLEDALEFNNEAIRQHNSIKIHIAIDTGMNRIGFKPNRHSLKQIKLISEMSNIMIEGVFTHFCLADAIDKHFTNLQYTSFRWMKEEIHRMHIKVQLFHCANSASILEMPETHEDMVRAGVIMYGMPPSADVSIADLGLRPVMSFKCRITHVKPIQKNEGVSYGHKYVATEPRIIATLPVGYADGFTRLLSNKGTEVLVHGQRAKVVGNICMDQCMIDITEIPDVNVGDEVVIFGSQGAETIYTDELADILGTINYEITCMISRRVPRYYMKNGQLSFYKSYLSDLAISMYNV